MQVFTDVLVRDSEKKHALVDKFWFWEGECQNKTCFGISKSIYQNLFFHRVFAMLLGLSI
jgi:hypothetical protein